MKIEQFDRPFSRADFERKIHHLMEQAKSGQLVLSAGVSTRPFLRIRTLPNGRIDMLSIDESVRLQANMSTIDFRALFGVAQQGESKVAESEE